MPPTSQRAGIYAISAPSGNFYIGSTSNFSRRKRQHFSALRTGKHCNQLLMNAWRKHYGRLIFSEMIVCRIEDLVFYEQFVIDALRPKYNLAPVAGCTRGVPWSDEKREKMMRALKGRKISEQARANMSAANKGQVPWIKGRRHAPETLAKIGAAAKGRPVGTETRRKMSANASLRSVDKDQLKRAQMAAADARRGTTIEAKTRAKISAKLMGHAVSAETRAKISEANRRVRMAKLAALAETHNTP